MTAHTLDLSVFDYLIDLLADKVAQKLSITPITQLIVEQPERVRIEGIRGLSKYLHVSTSTAQKLVNSNKVKTYRSGNKCFFYNTEIDLSLLES